MEAVDFESQVREGGGDGRAEERIIGGGGGGDEVVKNVLGAGGVLENGEDGGHRPPDVGGVEGHCNVNGVV